ncbi:AAC(3) family N-acetyltransferase [Streptomyces sp. SPB162]|uniref:aminoglycoside N(3)-acetyltransferase n=1 Tax=Streptomyces sp. SPB162 TaxID=2940560 RepID=UPI002404E0DF|nr:AAC(3) family N-acetyltransferase [Streptomyces sp. SPB162]MDF9810787.1 aminoglycoside 3-N-acetyltransferase [Streptomyces sp. SPB162]
MREPGVGDLELKITADLRALGLGRGDTVLVHASMSRVAPPPGSEDAVLRAMLTVTGPEGTIVAPAFTDENSLTSRAHLKAIYGLTERQVDAFRAAMRPFDLGTPSTSTGRLSERIRSTPGALRSDHPQTSFVAIGRLAEEITARHAPDCLLGEDSPLGTLYAADARILLLGVGFDSCSAFHLAEYRVPTPPRRDYTCKVATPYGPRWRRVRDVVLDDTDFRLIGRAVEAPAPGCRPLVVHGRVGRASARLLPFAPAVDAAVRWLTEHRPAAPAAAPTTATPAPGERVRDA